MKRFMVMCTCLSLVMIVVGGIPQASAELRGYEVVRSFGPIIKGGAKSAKIVYCSKGRVVLGGGVHRTWTGGCPVSTNPITNMCPSVDHVVLKSYPYKNPQNGQPGVQRSRWQATLFDHGGWMYMRFVLSHNDSFSQ
jgi:hypothetical protein